MTKRNLTIDFIKGIAIFTIVWMHISLGWFITEIGNPIVMAVFILLSGYFYKNQSWTDLIKKKSKTILLPWLIFAVIGYFFNLLYSTFIDHTAFRWDMFYTDIVAGRDFEANIPLWFLIVLFVVTLLTKALSYVPPVIRNTIYAFSCIAGVTLLDAGINNFYIGKILFYLPFFYIGYIIKPLNLSSINLTSRLLLWITAISLVVIKILFIDSFVIDYIIGGLVAIVVVVISVGDEASDKIKKHPFYRLVLYLGINSLVIMSFHILSNDFVWRILYPYFGKPGLWLSFVYACISILCCIPVIFTYNKWISARIR